MGLLVVAVSGCHNSSSNGEDEVIPLEDECYEIPPGVIPAFMGSIPEVDVYDIAFHDGELFIRKAHGVIMVYEIIPQGFIYKRKLRVESWKMFFSNDLMYTLPNQVLTIVDIQTGEILSELDLEWGATEVLIGDDDYIYVQGHPYLSVINVADPRNPVVEEEFFLNSSRPMAYSSGMLTVVKSDETNVYTLSDVSLEYQATIDESFKWMKVTSDSYLIGMNDNNLHQVYDILELSSPVLLGHTADHFSFSDQSVIECGYYVVGSNSMNLIEVYEIETQELVTSFVFEDKYIGELNIFNGLLISELDLYDLLTPEIM